MPSRPSPGCTIAPDVPDDIVTRDLSFENVHDDVSWSEISVRGAQLTGSAAHTVVIVQSRFTTVNLSEAHFTQLHVSDVELVNCNLSNMKVADSSFRTVVFAQCKLTGWNVTDSTFTDVEFRDCRMEFGSFAKAKFQHVTFRGCQLHDCDLSQTTLNDVRFVDCDLRRSMLSRVVTKRSEMRRSTIAGLRGLSELRGIAMEWNDILQNAEVLAAELGIRVLAGSDANDG